jgi:transglutaminase-like putative cysteine protease
MTAVAAVPLSLGGVSLYTPEDAMTTMRNMQRKVLASLKDPYVVHRANEVIAAAAPRDYPAQIAGIRLYLETYFYFVDNPIGMQRIQPPAVLLHDIDRRGMTQGACDDAAVLVAALGMANGIPARFIAYAFGVSSGNPAADRQQPYTHVIADLYDGRDWEMLDVTRPEDIARLPHVLRSLTLEL